MKDIMIGCSFHNGKQTISVSGTMRSADEIAQTIEALTILQSLLEPKKKPDALWFWL